MKLLVLLTTLVFFYSFTGVRAQMPLVSLWTNGSIYVDFDPHIHETTQWGVKYAAEYFEKRTCLRFHFNDTTPTEQRLLVDSTYSGAGVIGAYRISRLWLGTAPYNLKGIFHEMMHNLGWSHTEKRFDSHLYLQRWKPFDPDQYKPENTNRQGIPFDYSSSLFGYASPIDINQAYKCFEKCDKEPKPACKNGGVVDVNNCSKCFCPRQYSGDFCEERSIGNAPNECGKTIKVTENLQSMELPVKPLFEPVYIGSEEVDYTHCYYRLEAPACKRVQLTIRDASNQCSTSCLEGGLEVYGNVDKRQVGYRYCCNSRLNETVTSDYNEMMLDAYTWTSLSDSMKEWNTFTFKIDVIALD